MISDPKFLDENIHNFNLTNLSPCIDYGESTNFVYQGNAPDIGAIESEYSKFIGTKISGEIDSDLTKDKSPYIVTSDITVPVGKKVNINPGVVLKINASKSMYVNGELTVSGTQNDSVHIGNNSIYPIHWGNIVFNKGSSNKSYIKFSTITYGLSNSITNGGISCDNDSVTISDNYFANNGVSVYCGNGNKSKISSNTFYEHNDFTGTYIVYCDTNSKPLVERNTFYNSSLVADSANIIVLGNRFLGQDYIIRQQYWLIQLRNNTTAYIDANYFQNNSGAVLINKSTCKGYNNLLVNCGSSFLFSRSSGLLSNNTIYSDGLGISGIISTQNSKISLANSIIWCTGDSYSVAIKLSDSSIVEAKYCILSTSFSGDHIFYDNPLFVNADTGNFHLTANSPGINMGTPDTTGLSLPMNDFDGRPRVEEWNRIDIGCYESSIIIDGINTEENSVPSNFILYQNYPNPFNPATVISYSIPRKCYVTINIYDALGREIKTLVNEEKASGSYKIEFNASRLSSGIYFYRMQAGSFSETKKLVLLK